MELPVIIINWNGWEDTFKCLSSLAKDHQVRRVWVVDNGSAEDRSTECLNFFPDIRFIKLHDNYGWAGGNNHALRLAMNEGYDAAYLLNNDTKVHPGFLTEAYRALLSCPRSAGVGSVMLYEGGESVRFDGQHHLPGKVALPAPQDSCVRRTDVVVGAGMMIRLAAVKEHGLFDERFFLLLRREGLVLADVRLWLGYPCMLVLIL